MTADVLLDVQDLKVQFRTERGMVPAVDGLSYSVARGEAVAVVGESGSGKSVGARSLLALLPKTASITDGHAIFDGQDLVGMPERAMRAIRGRRIGMVFQNAMEAMSPTITLERQLTEHLVWHGVCTKAEARERAIRALGEVGIPEPERRLRMYPFQLSGGMRQRAMIAMATAIEPDLLIADEPTTAVDVTVQRQILELLKAQKERGTGIIMITHDLGVARFFCDTAVVMYAGQVVERGPMAEFIDRPAHPYAQGLLGSTIDVGDRHRKLSVIPGSPVDVANRPSGCPFRTRCALADADRCTHAQSLESVSPGRVAACWRSHDHV
ncbi:ABC transporter ATP-binding protein [Ruania alkalisoli]|uniref:ABC transporter ATP-binding protein n=1 Tax=Ruania alkalisoli TaxID=2779775 RepID=A0A7M1SS00_9MICO|nr:ABC transporter ATP-binding protein [Ruania alkalisoli]QOR70338.1 ABC transporter ATP-binding protein [Ruania alkalisoli]